MGNGIAIVMLFISFVGHAFIKWNLIKVEFELCRAKTQLKCVIIFIGMVKQSNCNVETFFE